MGDAPRPVAFLPIKPDTLLILLALAARPLHGYGLIRDVQVRSGGETVLQTGALYRTLRRLLKDGLIEDQAPPGAERDADQRRQYYGLTRLGRSVLAAEIERMSRLVRAARFVHARKKPGLA